MPYYLIKLVITAGLIVLISELAKRSTFMGALLAALPLVSLFSFLWIYIETGNTEKVARMSQEVFWFVLPTLPMFLILPELLRRQINFYFTLLICCALTSVLYGAMLYVLSRLGVRL